VEMDCRISVADPSQITACGIVMMAPATAPEQASRQQAIPSWPFGQQEFCDASGCETKADWQCANVSGETPAKAINDPCRPMAIITITAMS